MRTVCEIGFNAGHSTLTWLEANPNLVVYTFDINHWKYTEVMVNYLKAKYPRRLNSCFGDSTVTLPLVSANTDIKCDVAVVDGGHEGNIPIIDIMNMKSFSHNETILLIDDIGLHKRAVFNAIATLRGNNTIEKIFANYDSEMKGGFGAFKYLGFS